MLTGRGERLKNPGPSRYCTTYCEPSVGASHIEKSEPGGLTTRGRIPTKGALHIKGNLMRNLHGKKLRPLYLTIITALSVATVCALFTSASRTSQAQAAGTAPEQTIRQLTSVGQTIIHFIPQGANVVSQPEFLLDDAEVGVKPQTPGAAAVRGASALSTSIARKHGLAIPGKNGAQGFSAMATVGWQPSTFRAVRAP
jgi:hypothetical protein